MPLVQELNFTCEPGTHFILIGPLLYQVQTAAGIILHRHVNDLWFHYPSDNTCLLDNDCLDSDFSH